MNTFWNDLKFEFKYMWRHQQDTLMVGTVAAITSSIITVLALNTFNVC